MIYIKRYFVTFESRLFNSKTRVDNNSEKNEHVRNNFRESSDILQNYRNNAQRSTAYLLAHQISSTA